MSAHDEPSVAYMEHVRRLVDQAPPLTAAQRDRIRRILQPVIDARAARSEPSHRESKSLELPGAL